MSYPYIHTGGQGVQYVYSKVGGAATAERRGGQFAQGQVRGAVMLMCLLLCCGAAVSAVSAVVVMLCC
jgi:hypothetical protein